MKKTIALMICLVCCTRLVNANEPANAGSKEKQPVSKPATTKTDTGGAFKKLEQWLNSSEDSEQKAKRLKQEDTKIESDTSPVKVLQSYAFRDMFYEQTKKYQDSVGKVMLPYVFEYYKNSAEKEAARINYDIGSLRDRSNKFRFQQTIRVVSFVLVCISFVFGLVFSALQFKMDYHRFQDARPADSGQPKPVTPKKDDTVKADDANKQPAAATTVTNTTVTQQVTTTTPAAPADTAAAGVVQQVATTTPAATTFEANKDGIKISSSVIGLLVLIVSLVFFYLYVTLLYNLQEIAK